MDMPQFMYNAEPKLQVLAARRNVKEVVQMSVEDLSEVLEDGNAVEGAQFIDVREPHEEEIASLPRFHLMPLSRCVGVTAWHQPYEYIYRQERIPAALPPGAAEPVSRLRHWAITFSLDLLSS